MNYLMEDLYFTSFTTIVDTESERVRSAIGKQDDGAVYYYQMDHYTTSSEDIISMASCLGRKSKPGAYSVKSSLSFRDSYPN